MIFGLSLTACMEEITMRECNKWNGKHNGWGCEKERLVIGILRDGVSFGLMENLDLVYLVDGWNMTNNKISIGSI